MVVGIKDTAKLIGISVISCCAVLVCSLFLNFYIDMESIKAMVAAGEAMSLYQAQVSTAKVTCLVSGGCLCATSAVMLLFYIRHYIDTHAKELGILKALGYSRGKLAKHFWVFGSSVFLGTAAGFVLSFLLMPSFYRTQNEDGLLPEITIHFHPKLFLYLVVLPTAAFALLAICYASLKLKRPVDALLKGGVSASPNIKGALLQSRNRRNAKIGKPDSPSWILARQKEQEHLSFLAELKKDTLQSKKTLSFFVVFSSFCFSSMTQMSASMKDLSSAMMGAMMLMIGIILACTTLFLAIAAVIHGNQKTIAMMRVFGYTHKQCHRALLGGYRPMGYLGFAIGTVYQYALLKIMVSVVFKDIPGVPEYRFDFPMMLLSLAFFLAAYELLMHLFAGRIQKISIKEIMQS